MCSRKGEEGNKLMRSYLQLIAATTLPICFATVTFAQSQPSPGGWRKVSDQNPQQQDNRQQDNRQPEYRQSDNRDNDRDRNDADSRGPDQSGPPPAAAFLPPQLTIPVGTWIKVRVDQMLSSDRNRVGDGFMATLSQPVIVNGFVVARRGQIISGRVAEAQKAGRISGTSKLGVEITELSLADGQQLPIRTQLAEYAGGTSVGRDLGAVGTTTGVGAMIGAAAGGGFGAGMGAIAGAGASMIGVLATRGRSTEIYPETMLTFRLMEPLMVATDRSGDAFQPVRQGDYEQNHLIQRTVVQRPAYGYGPGYGYGYGPGFYGYPRYGYGFGPSLYFHSGSRYYGGYGRRR